MCNRRHWSARGRLVSANWWCFVTCCVGGRTLQPSHLAKTTGWGWQQEGRSRSFSYLRSQLLHHVQDTSMSVSVYMSMPIAHYIHIVSYLCLLKTQTWSEWPVMICQFTMLFSYLSILTPCCCSCFSVSVWSYKIS